MFFLNLLIILASIITARCNQELNGESKILTRNYNQFVKKYNDELCESQLNALFLSFLNRKSWALNAVDSWEKLPSGLLKGNIIGLGNFDQCMEIYYDTSNDENVGIFKGQYCLAKIDVAKISITTINTNITLIQKIFPVLFDNAILSDSQLLGINLQLAICVSGFCSPSYLSKAIENQLGITFIDVTEDNCQQRVKWPYTAWDIVTISIVSVVMFLMICSTTYDLYKYARNEERNKNLIAFSIYTNGEKLFKCTQNKSINVIECVHGIRSLAIIWIVYAHSFNVLLMMPQINFVYLLEWQRNLYSKLIFGATIGVDTFFFLSGLLVTWSVLKELDRSHGRLNIFMMYFHRYIRLTPTLALAILTFVTFSEHVTDGPLRHNLIDMNDKCREWWWTSILYVQNYVNLTEICFGHTWYLSVDMQLFIISPLILYPLWRWRNKFVWVIPLLIALSMACVFTIFYLKNYSILSGHRDNDVGKEKIYTGTHTRCGPYLIGILLGYVLHNIKGKVITIPKTLNIVGWIFSVGSVFTIIFGVNVMYQEWHPFNVLDSAIYEPFSRVGWAICLSWIVFACVHGYGGPINWFLSLPQWQPISRLSYAIYIIHLPIQFLLVVTTRTSSHFSNINITHRFWGDFGLTLTIAIFWTMAFESPIIILEKMLVESQTATKSRKNLIKKNETTQSNEQPNV